MDGLPLGTSLGGQSIVSIKCLCCTVSKEYNQHPFVSSPRARAIWKFISSMWDSISGGLKSLFQWVFGHMELKMPPHIGIAFRCLRYWRLLYG